MTRADAEALIRGVSGCIYSSLDHAYAEALRRCRGGGGWGRGDSETLRRLEEAWAVVGRADDAGFAADDFEGSAGVGEAPSPAP